MKDPQLENSIISLHPRGWSTRRLSREFGISRERVQRVLHSNYHERNTGEPTKKKKPGKQGSKMDAYKGVIREALDKYTDPPPTNQRIFEIIKQKGFDGGITIVSTYLKQIRGKQVHEPIICIETTPGQRAAHDWSDEPILFAPTGEKEKITFFSIILGYSRRQYICLAEDKTQQSLFNCLIEAFVHFEGVPKEIKSDNQKACVDRWEMGRPVFNTKFLEFSSYYKFKPLAITPREPRENLKIERPFYYLQTNFLNARSFYDKHDLQKQLAAWLKGKNDQRIHRTTRKKPIEAWQEELAFLHPLPKKHYDTSVFEYRVVNNESCVVWGNHYYVVPNHYMYETCPVRTTSTKIIIYTPDFEQIVTYPLAQKGHPEKYIGRDSHKKPLQMRLAAKQVLERLEPFGPYMQEYIKELKQHKSNYLHHLRHVLGLKVNYHKDDIVIALRRALKYRVYEAGAIENFLKVNAEKKNEIKLLPDKNQLKSERHRQTGFYRPL